MTAKFVLTFHTTHDALHAADTCAAAGIPHEKIPTPRALSSECGFAVLAGPVIEPALMSLITARALRFAAYYRVSEVDTIRTYTRLSQEVHP